MTLFPLYGHGYCVSVLHLGLPYIFRQALTFYIIGHLHLMKRKKTSPYPPWSSQFASENEWLEDVPFLLGKSHFQGRTVSFSPGIFFTYTIIPYISIPTKIAHTESQSLHPWNPLKPPPATWLPRSAVPDLRTSRSSCLKKPLGPHRDIPYMESSPRGNQWSC